MAHMHIIIVERGWITVRLRRGAWAPGNKKARAEAAAGRARFSICLTWLQERQITTTEL